MSDIILDACMQYENYPIKTVEEEAFYSYYILYHYFKISKIRKKIERKSDRQKKHNPGECTFWSKFKAFFGSFERNKMHTCYKVHL